jgi:hypothetical protein
MVRGAKSVHGPEQLAVEESADALQRVPLLDMVAEGEDLGRGARISSRRARVPRPGSHSDGQRGASSVSFLRGQELKEAEAGSRGFGVETPKPTPAVAGVGSISRDRGQARAPRLGGYLSSQKVSMRTTS